MLENADVTSCDNSEASLPQHFEIQGVLGEGGMGKVYLAKDTRLGRMVAIKQIKYQCLNKQSLTSHHDIAFKEASALAKLNHSHIVQIHDIHQSAEQVSLILEYVDGQTLWQYQRGRLLDVPQKLDLIHQISAGLAAAHAVGITHCDLKASNVLVDKNNRVKITDFGIARIFDVETAQHVSGTVENKNALSPEQLQGKPVDYRADLYALGLLAFQLFAGRSPFGAGTGEQVRQKMLSGKSEDACHIMPAIPSELAALINQLLMVNPEERPKDSQQVAERLHQILVSETQKIALNEETIPIVSSEHTSHTSKISLYKLPVIFMSLLALVFLGWLIIGPVIGKDKHRYVVVLTPDTSELDDMDAERQRLIIATIEDGIRQWVVNTPQLALVPYNKALNADLGYSNIARATGATDIIQSKLRCTATKCEVRYSLLNGDSWTVNKQALWPTTSLDYKGLFETANAQTAALFTELKSENQHIVDISAEDYLAYVKIYDEINYRGNISSEILDELGQILVRSPTLYAGYTLYRETSLERFVQYGDEKQLDKLSALLQQAPEDYRTSDAYLINALHIALHKGEDKLVDSLLNELEYNRLSADMLSELKGHVAYQRGRLQQAILHYSAALKVRKSTQSMHSLALSYYLTGEYDLAIELLNQVLAILPEEHGVVRTLADIHLARGDTENAIAGYKKTLAVNTQPAIMNNLALAYMLEGNYALSLQSIQNIGGIDSHTEYMLNLADINKLNGRIETAESIYHQIISDSNNSNSVFTILARAQAFAQLGKREEAIVAINKAIRMSPNNSDYAYTAALVYALVEESTSAIVQVKHALNAGYSAKWFTLPWFRALCREQVFVQTLKSESRFCEAKVK